MSILSFDQFLSSCHNMGQIVMLIYILVMGFAIDYLSSANWYGNRNKTVVHCLGKGHAWASDSFTEPDINVSEYFISPFHLAIFRGQVMLDI